MKQTPYSRSTGLEISREGLLPRLQDPAYERYYPDEFKVYPTYPVS